jgi:DNA repair exonuclease SbcCD ATPase subunit
MAADRLDRLEAKLDSINQKLAILDRLDEREIAGARRVVQLEAKLAQLEERVAENSRALARGGVIFALIGGLAALAGRAVLDWVKPPG